MGQAVPPPAGPVQPHSQVICPSTYTPEIPSSNACSSTTQPTPLPFRIYGMPKAKRKVLYVCQSCGTSSLKWLGRCPACDEWDTLVEEQASAPPSLPSVSAAVHYQAVEEERFERVQTNNAEFDRVLGGGIVPGSLVLLGGEPGIGKSTLLLQIAETLSRQKLRVLYVAGEESARQIKLRGDRLGLSGAHLFISGETCVERALEEIEQVKPDVLVVDSIQTVYSEKIESIPGSIGQIRECALQFLHLSKNRTIPTFLIGHITKDGALAGPKALEHIVDAVLYFEGDRHHNQKIIRTVKNRFGPANELGIFEMTGEGLKCVENPSRLFLSERAEAVPGSAVLCAMQGSRPVLVELQALVSLSNFGTARRMTTGADKNRVSLLLAMLEKRVGVQMLGSDVYVNVAGGITLNEPAIDLAIVAAVVSSFRDLPLPSETVIFGELGLAGEVRAVSFAHTRIKEAASLGFKRVILPKSNLPLPERVKGIEVVGVSSVNAFLDVVEF